MLSCDLEEREFGKGDSKRLTCAFQSPHEP